MDILNQRVVDLIEKSGLQQKEIAKVLGVTPSTISEWKGNRQSPLQHIANIANYFGVSVDYLMGLEKKEPPVLQGSSKEVQELSDQLFNELNEIKSDEERKSYLTFFKETMKNRPDKK